MLPAKGLLLAVGFATLALGCASQPKNSTAPLATRFQAADTNQDGKLTRREYGYAMIEEVFTNYDKNGDGFISEKEFVALGGSPESFRKIDVSGEGKVTLAEAKSAKIALDAMTVGFYGADVDKDGYVTLGEAIAYREKARAYTR